MALAPIRYIGTVCSRLVGYFSLLDVNWMTIKFRSYRHSDNQW